MIKFNKARHLYFRINKDRIQEDRFDIELIDYIRSKLKKKKN